MSARVSGRARRPGSRAALRPFVADDLEPVLAAMRAGETVPAGARGGGPSREAVRRMIASSGELLAGRLELAIEAEGRPVGVVEARAPRGAFPPGVFELGIQVWDPRDRGRGHGTQAVALLAAHLFGGLGARRVQAVTEVGNAAMRRALERAGFRMEGVLRGFLPPETAAGTGDCAVYGITNDEWENDREPWT